ncbi:MAG: ATP synthase subunit C [Candidatus Marinimicrobia bacterium]|nr:ATP synthase subunit C [Candidatus Neomarinimicrobiota bacterium]
MTKLASIFKNMQGINKAISVIAGLFLIFGLLGIIFSPVGLFAQEGAVQEQAQSGTNKVTGSSASMAFLAAGLALGISVLGAGIALSKIGSAAVAAIAEKPEITGRVIVFAGLAEGLAIWGLIVAVLILGKI